MNNETLSSSSIKVKMRKETLERRTESKNPLKLRQISEEKNETLGSILQRLMSTNSDSIQDLEAFKQRLATEIEDPNPLLDDENNFLLSTLLDAISTPNGRRGLIGLQISANLHPMTEANVVKCVRSLGPYVVTSLSSGSYKIREAAGLVLGNWALHPFPSIIKILVNQETLSSLIKRLEIEREKDVESAFYYAAYNIIYADKCLLRNHRDFADRLAENCLKNLSVKSPVELSWVLFALSCYEPLHRRLHGAINKAFEILTYEIFQKSDPRPLVKIVTPLVRFLANLCSGKKDSGEDACVMVLRQPDLPAILTTLLGTNYVHLVKETLWWFGNIVNNESVLVQEEFVELDLMDKMEYHTVQALQKLDPYSFRL